jgi:uncharacterized membrane protein
VELAASVGLTGDLLAPGPQVLRAAALAVALALGVDAGVGLVESMAADAPALGAVVHPLTGEALDVGDCAAGVLGLG